ncbi:MAG TPA: hypothetical protein VHD84_00885 [Candidatus Saccharimonadales bacterium]|nr:hypothetical protein [Candidatus Saccharimonadales bacterium]
MPEVTEQPRYEHDCDDCVFLGQWGIYDLYYCPREPTVLARTGPDGEYRSGMCFVGISEPLTEAYNRAVERGLAEPGLDNSSLLVRPGDSIDFSKPFVIRIGG